MIHMRVVKGGRRILIAAACLSLAAAACGGGKGSRASDDGSKVAERAVRFDTSDGVTLSGRLFGSGRVGITLAHMAPADAESWYPHARTIAEAGYMALAFNFRGYANSEGTQNTTKAAVDVEAARDFLETEGARDFAYVGASMGGTASLIAARTTDALAVVAISAPLRFRGLDAAPIAGAVQRPVLLMWSNGDEQAQQAVDDLESSLPNPETLGYEGSAHGTQLLDSKPEAVEEIVAFLKRYAPPMPPEPEGE